MRTTDPELHARRRQEILAAAESCFVKNGFHAASMQDIARAAGVSMGSLYRYFANKEAIIGSFAESDLTEATDAIAAWGQSPRPGPAFRVLVHAFLQAATVPARAAIEAEIYAESLRNDALRKLLARHEVAVTKAWAAAIAAQRHAGRLTPQNDAGTVADLVLSLLDGYATRRLLLAKRGSAAGEDALIAQLLVLLGLGQA